MQTTTQKLDKVSLSISNHIARGNSYKQQRSYDLKDRYETLKEQAIKEGVWNSWCDSKGFCTSHNSGDLFA